MSFHFTSLLMLQSVLHVHLLTVLNQVSSWLALLSKSGLPISYPQRLSLQSACAGPQPHACHTTCESTYRRRSCKRIECEAPLRTSASSTELPARQVPACVALRSVKSHPGHRGGQHAGLFAAWQVGKCPLKRGRALHDKVDRHSSSPGCTRGQTSCLPVHGPPLRSTRSRHGMVLLITERLCRLATHIMAQANAQPAHEGC